MDSSSDESELGSVITATPPELRNAAQLLHNDLLPAKSKEKYNTAYENFKKWQKEKNTISFSENVLLAYFGELAIKYKPTSLWAIYSMIKCTLKVKNCVDIDSYAKLKAFLKRKTEGHVTKKSNILTGEDVEKFITDAPDHTYLATKTALILGVAGALRGHELCNITIDDIEKHGEMLLVKIPNTKNKIPKSFVVTGEHYQVVKKYQSLRPDKASSNRFFLQIRNGKCTAQVIGKNKFGSMPKEIAQYLNLPDATSYTGHSFRRTSATLLADSGVDILTLKRHGGWKSSSVAEGYIDHSLTNKIDVSNKIKESIQLCHNIMPEQTESVASSSSTLIHQRPQLVDCTQEVDTLIQPCSETTLEPPIIPSRSPVQNIPDIQNAHMSQVTNQENISNSIHSIKYPGKNMVLNFNNNNNCTITFNFNK